MNLAVFLFAIVFNLSVGLSSASAATVIYDEARDGDLGHPNVGEVPTLQVSVGTNVIRGTIVQPLAETDISALDAFIVSVPAGFYVKRVALNASFYNPYGYGITEVHWEGLGIAAIHWVASSRTSPMPMIERVSTASLEAGLYDVEINYVASSAGDPLTPDIYTWEWSIDVATIPLPPGAWLFASALMTPVLTRFRKR